MTPEEAARAVWEVATRKGALFSTDPETGSDRLVGFFVPAHAMNELGAALVESRTAAVLRGAAAPRA